MRRFERIDGARRQILESVINTWHDICKGAIQRERYTVIPKGETILEVEDNNYTTILEIQAARFRKIEQNQWKALKKMLFVEMKRASEDLLGKKILERQDSRHEEKLAYQRKLEQERALKIQREFEQAKEKEKLQLQEIKDAQKDYLVVYQKKKEQDRQNARSLKLANEKRESDRMQRELFLKQKREDEYRKSQLEAFELTRQLEAKEKETQDRLEEERREKEKAMKEKSTKVFEHVTKTRENLEQTAESKKAEVSRYLTFSLIIFHSIKDKFKITMNASIILSIKEKLRKKIIVMHMLNWFMRNAKKYEKLMKL